MSAKWIDSTIYEAMSGPIFGTRTARPINGSKNASHRAPILENSARGSLSFGTRPSQIATFRIHAVDQVAHCPAVARCGQSKRPGVELLNIAFEQLEGHTVMRQGLRERGHVWRGSRVPAGTGIASTGADGSPKGSNNRGSRK